MRYAICSDIHANLQAWNAVLIDARSMQAGRIICLGDIVGYGPNPREVLESVHAAVHFMVLGNHDAALCGLLDPKLFTDDARDILAWQEQQLGAEAVAFLKELPLSLAGDNFRCTHSEFSEPGCFSYVMQAEDAAPSFDAAREDLLFIGHTHVPGIFVTGGSGSVHAIDAQDFEQEAGKRYLVNVGSVGQPRDGDTRSSYVIYDSSTRSVTWRRIPFDLDAFNAAIEEAGIPDTASRFTQYDPRKQLPALREMLNFNPPESREQGASGAREVQSLEVLQGRVRRWKGLSVTLSAAIVIVIAGLGFFAYRHATRASDSDRTGGQPIHAGARAPGENLLPMPGAHAHPLAGMEGWRVRLGNKRRQQLSVTGQGLDAIWTLSSESSDTAVWITSPTIIVQPKMRMQLAAEMKKSADFEGSLSVVISLTQSDGATREQFVVKEATTHRRDDWLRAQKTFNIPAGAESLHFHLHGRFSGEARVRGLTLARRGN